MVAFRLMVNEGVLTVAAKSQATQREKVAVVWLPKNYLTEK